MIYRTSKFHFWLSCICITAQTYTLHVFRKLEDFRREGETKVSEQILQTRYDYHHNKRYHKLYEIYLKREEQK